MFLAVSFLVAGLIKVTLPFSQVGDYLAWAKDQPEPLIRFIGVCELAAVFGLTVPGWTRTLPSLIPTTAFALMGLMFLAIGFHLMRHEVGLIGAPLIMLALSTFVAFGRTAVPIPPSEHRGRPRPLTR